MPTRQLRDDHAILNCFSGLTTAKYAQNRLGFRNGFRGSHQTCLVNLLTPPLPVCNALLQAQPAQHPCGQRRSVRCGYNFSATGQHAISLSGVFRSGCAAHFANFCVAPDAPCLSTSTFRCCHRLIGLSGDWAPAVPTLGSNQDG